MDTWFFDNNMLPNSTQQFMLTSTVRFTRMFNKRITNNKLKRFLYIFYKIVFTQIL